MKKFFIAIVIALTSALTPAFAQEADAIIGEYESVQGGSGYKVRVTKNSDGTYKAQLFWASDSINPKTGKKDLDVKNPDKSLRNTPVDQIVLINGLTWDSAKKQYGNAKIYDPQRGIRVNVTARFEPSGKLCLKGTVLGIGEKIYWTRIK